MGHDETKGSVDLFDEIGPDESCVDLAEQIAQRIDDLPEPEQVKTLNAVRETLHEVSPFKSEPTDCVIWVKNENVEANDYNPNEVAPPEMELLQRSIEADGYTQPIVAWDKGEQYEVVDGFHRNRVGQECKAVRERINGYLPLTIANTDRLDRGDRMASTIRHNRARGKHQVGELSEIIQELVKRNWTDKRIANELGMEPDEVLRLKQVTGLAEMFSDEEFSEAWEAVTNG